MKALKEIPTNLNQEFIAINKYNKSLWCDKFRINASGVIQKFVEILYPNDDWDSDEACWEDIELSDNGGIYGSDSKVTYFILDSEGN